MKAYLVTEKGWTYNDNWYYQGGYDEGGGDTPVKIYLKKEKAEHERLAKSRDFLFELLKTGEHHRTFLNLRKESWESENPLSNLAREMLVRLGMDNVDEWPYDRDREILKVLEAQPENVQFEFISLLNVEYFEITEIEFDPETIGGKA